MYMGGDDEDYLIETLAKALGWTHLEIENDNTLHSIWEGPIGSKHYSPFRPPLSSWKMSKRLIKLMGLAGYESFSLHKNSGMWIASFNCQYGPCTRHGTSSSIHHGSSSLIGEPVYGMTAGEAIAMAALMAIASGKQITYKQDIIGDMMIPVDFDIDKVVSIIGRYSTHILEMRVSMGVSDANREGKIRPAQ